MKLSLVLAFFLLPILAQASPTSLGYQGRIVKSDGQPLEYSSVSFEFRITNPDGTCVLYREQKNGVDMANSKGIFDTAIGSGTKLFPTSSSFGLLDAFANAGTLNCEGGATYSPSADDGRKLRVQFHDGTGWKLISPDNIIRSVPYSAQSTYAVRAGRLNNKTENDFVLKADVPTCATGYVLTSTGSGVLSCVADAAGSSGTVNTITGTAPINSTNNGGGSYTISVSIGTTAGTVAAGNDTRIANAMQSGAAAGGDLSGTYPNPTVSKIAGTTVSISTPTTGQFLKYSAGSWINSGITTSDISGMSAYVSQSAFNSVVTPAASCTTSQTMYWNSVSSTFACQNISVTNTPSGNIAATTLQGAINELDSEKVSKAGDTMTGALNLPANGLNVGTNQIAMSGGKVGILTTTPTVELEVNGTAKANEFCIGASCITNWPSGGSGSVTSVTSANADIAVTNSTSTPVLTLNSGTGAHQILKLNASSEIPAVSGANLTNLNAANISAGILPAGRLPSLTGDVSSSAGSNSLTLNTVSVAKGGTGVTSFTGNKLVATNAGGTALTSWSCPVGQVVKFDASGVLGCDTIANILGYTPANGTNYVAKAGDTMTGTLNILNAGNTAGALKLEGQRNTTEGYAATISLGAPASPASTDKKNFIIANVNGDPGGENRIDITSRTDDYATAPHVVMSLTHSGNVGIGTITPGQKLSVAGMIETTTGGIKFPDGSIQTTASSGGSGTNNTILTSLPDVISCTNSTGSGNWLLYNIGYQAGASNSVIYGLITVSNMYINVNATTGAIASHTGWTPANCAVGTTMSALYTAGRAFNIAKGPAAAWLQNGSHAYYNAGNVGVGTNTPSYLLHALSNTQAAVTSETTNNSNFAVYRMKTPSKIYQLSTGGSGTAWADKFYVYDETANTGRFVIDTNGNVGVGLSSPSAKFEVSGTAKATEFCLGASCITAWPSGGGSGTAGGDLSGTLPNPTVAKVQGVSVSSTAPTSAGQVLRYNSSAWAPGFLSLADIRSTVTVSNTMFPTTSCTAAQTLTWSSLTDTMSCTTIGISASQVTDGTLLAARLPALTGDVTATAGTGVTTLSNSGVTAGTYSKVTVDAKGRVTTGSDMSSSDITTALTYTPVNKTGDTMTGALNLPSNGLSVGTNQLVVSGSNVGIGTTSPAGALDVSSTTGALVPPRMTASQRDALTAVDGSIIYNTTSGRLNVRESGAWRDLSTVGGDELSVTNTANLGASTSPTSSHTFSNLAIGAAADDRHIVAVMAGGHINGGSGFSVSSLTIGGITATKIVELTSTSHRGISIWIARVPAGTSADVVANYSTNNSYKAAHIYRVTGLSSITPVSTTTAQATVPATTASVDMAKKSVLIIGAAGWGVAGINYTWTGATKDSQLQGDTYVSASSSAMFTAPYAAAGYGVTATASSSSAWTTLVGVVLK